MATTTERLGIVETKVENLSGKLDDIKVDVKDMHDCLDRTRDELKGQLEKMYEASCAQHAEMSKKISALEKIREKTMWMVAGAVAMAGIFSGHLEKVLAFFH
jgi:dsDNA-specific endonuclease/ATPase MutS2